MAKAKPRPKTAATPTQVYQIKVTLEGAKPPIWRRLLVSSDASLADLHDIIQVAMGWTDSHMHAFVINGESYGRTGPYALDDALDELRFTLNQVAPREKAKFRYEYDFGDDWRHTILVEKILPPDPKAHSPSCVKGARNCPPEDCGGVYGYEEFLDAVADPKHPEHDDMIDWAGGEFDPEAFDLEATNAELRQLG